MSLKEVSKIKKLFVVILLTIIWYSIFSNVKFCYAYDASGHDAVLNKVLFGNEAPSFVGDKNNALRAIDNASYLCIDQYNSSGSAELNFLRNTMGIKNIIRSVKEINFTGNYSHRKFTHQGWNYKFTHTKIPGTDIFEDANWDKRKKVLLETCKKIFPFDFQLIGYDKKCDAFSSMIYYMHLIGDYEDMSESDYDKYKANANKHQYMIPLYKINDNVNILNELEANFRTLFSSQKEDNNYRNLLSPSISEIKSIKNRLVTVSSHSEFQEICKDLINVLQDNVPELLKKEKFFRNVFYD